MAVINKPMAWSFSTLDAYASCPLQLKETRLTKRFSDRNKWNVTGTNDHESFEQRIVHNKPLPQEFEKFEPGVARLLQIPGIASAEVELCLDQNWQPTGWFSKNAWARAKIDVSIFYRERGIVTQLDWKFGKYRKDNRFTQLKVNNLLSHATAQANGLDIKRFNNGLVWVNSGFEIEPFSLKVEDMDRVRCEVMELVETYAEAYETDNFPAKKSGLCRQHCPVITCKHNGLYSKGKGAFDK